MTATWRPTRSAAIAAADQNDRLPTILDSDISSLDKPDPFKPCRIAAVRSATPPLTRRKVTDYRHRRLLRLRPSGHAPPRRREGNEARRCMSTLNLSRRHTAANNQQIDRAETVLRTYRNSRSMSQMGQRTKSLRSSPLRGSKNRRQETAVSFRQHRETRVVGLNGRIFRINISVQES